MNRVEKRGRFGFMNVKMTSLEGLQEQAKKLAASSTPEDKDLAKSVSLADEKKSEGVTPWLTNGQKIEIWKGGENITPDQLEKLAKNLADKSNNERESLKGDPNERKALVDSIFPEIETEKKELEADLKNTITARQTVSENLEKAKKTETQSTEKEALLKENENLEKVFDKLGKAILTNIDTRNELAEVISKVLEGFEETSKRGHTQVGTGVKEFENKKIETVESEIETVDIDLENQFLSRSEVIQLANFLKERTFELGTLNLKNCDLDDEDVKIIMDALKSRTWGKIERIDLSENNVGDKGAEKIADVLDSMQIGIVDEICLNDTKVGDEGILALTRAIRGNPNGISSLKCQGNNAVTIEGARKLTDNLISVRTTGVNFAIDVLTYSEKEQKELTKATKKLENRGITPIKSRPADKVLAEELGISHSPVMSGASSEQAHTKSLLEKIAEKINVVNQKLPVGDKTISKPTQWIKDQLEIDLNKQLNGAIDDQKNPITSKALKKISKGNTVIDLREMDKVLTNVLKALKEEKNNVAVAALKSYQAEYIQNKEKLAKRTFLERVVNLAKSAALTGQLAISKGIESLTKWGLKHNPLKSQGEKTGKAISDNVQVRKEEIMEDVPIIPEVLRGPPPARPVGGPPVVEKPARPVEGPPVSHSVILNALRTAMNTPVKTGAQEDDFSWVDDVDKDLGKGNVKKEDVADIDIDEAFADLDKQLSSIDIKDIEDIEDIEDIKESELEGLKNASEAIGKGEEVDDINLDDLPDKSQSNNHNFSIFNSPSHTAEPENETPNASEERNHSKTLDR